MNLDEYLRSTGETNIAFSKRTGIGKISISRLRNNRQWPGYDTALKIHEATGGKVVFIPDPNMRT